MCRPAATASPSYDVIACSEDPVPGTPTAAEVLRERVYASDGDLQPRTLFFSHWSTTLFQCCIEPSTCFLACCCPCVIFGRIAEIVDRGRTPCILGACMYETLRTVTCCACLYSAFFRAKLRTRYRLPETPAADWAVHCMCEPCALSQEYRELQRRGYDPSIGWLENIERETLATAAAPVLTPAMTR